MGAEIAVIKAQAVAFNSSGPHDGIIQPDSENGVFNDYLSVPVIF
jgi:hypothetical protein